MAKITMVMEVECFEENAEIINPITKNQLIEFCKSKGLNITDINLPNMKVTDKITQLDIYSFSLVGQFFVNNLEFEGPIQLSIWVVRDKEI